MIKLPSVLGLILCRRFDVDIQRSETSLVGLFHTLDVPRFPSPPQRFTVYSALYDGVGEGTMELVCTRLETEQDVYSYKRWTAFPGRGQIAHMEIKVRQCVFPAAGRYSLNLHFDKQDLTSRSLDVQLRDRDRP